MEETTVCLYVLSGSMRQMARRKLARWWAEGDEDGTDVACWRQLMKKRPGLGGKTQVTRAARMR